MDKQISFYESKLRYEIDSSDLYQAMTAKENIIVIDARSAEAYEQQHIPSAINIPHKDMTAKLLDHLDIQALYVTYCDGIGCNASTKGALNMARLGFRVKELIGGLDWWLRDGYQTQGTQGVVGLNTECGC